ncbi:MAG: hypothetical protein QME78_14220 [Thermodesulfobacteriota bacterium]|nr:hypothetical protein [Thermodesulfobacteriota bacterium]
MPESSPPTRAIRRGAQRYNTLQPGGICFVFLKLHDRTGEVLADTQYTLRGLQRGTSISGTTDGDGILRQEFLFDDHYELECRGKREIVEVYYLAERERYEGKPWFLYMRDLGPSGAVQEEG